MDNIDEQSKHPGNGIISQLAPSPYTIVWIEWNEEKGMDGRDDQHEGNALPQIHNSKSPNRD